MLNQLLGMLIYVKRFVIKVKVDVIQKKTWRNIEGSGRPRVEKKSRKKRKLLFLLNMMYKAFEF